MSNNASSPLYSAITLGSNSFNMLVAQTVDDKPFILAKYKQKVRLAEGINASGELADDVMARGIDCLAMFADKLALHQIKHCNVAVLATATLRQISNAQTFHQRALPVLGLSIEVISGEREAELIYLGMSSTTPGIGRRLVIDIGGASTEFVVGDEHRIIFKTSVPIGCVLLNNHIFTQIPYSLADFDAATKHVTTALAEHLDTLTQLDWQQSLGASGVVQSVTALLRARKQDELITYDVLKGLREEMVAQADTLKFGLFAELGAERSPTFAAGVAILLALFEILDMDSISLAGGALREGVLSELAANVC